MKIVIADDEPLARQRLRKQLDALLPDAQCLEAANGIEAVEQVAAESADIALLDIRMPGMSGLEAARHLSEQPCPPAVIFTTAYDEFALKAFETHAVAYLLKPIRQEQLRQALDASQRLNRAQLAALNEEQDEGAGEPRSHISAHNRGELVLIPVGEIAYFFAEHKYVTVVHAHGEELIEEPLKSLEQEFADSFVRIHRNALVKKEKIERLSKTGDGRTQLYLRGVNQPLEVSRRHVAQIRSLMK